MSDVFNQLDLTPQFVLSKKELSNPITVLSSGCTRDFFLNDPSFIQAIMHTEHSNINRTSKIISWRTLLEKLDPVKTPLLLRLMSGNQEKSELYLPLQKNIAIIREEMLVETELNLLVLNNCLTGCPENIDNNNLNQFIRASNFVEYYKMNLSYNRSPTETENLEFVSAVNIQRRFGMELYASICREAFSTEKNLQDYLSKKEEIDGLIGIFHSAVMNLSNSIGWTCFCISKLSEKDSFRLLREENYLYFVILESLRLFPPVWIFKREVRKNFYVGEMEFIIGDKLYFSSLLLHRTERYWQNPEDFLPDRFKKYQEDDAWAFIPFGRSFAKCPGTKVSIFIMKEILKDIIQKYKIIRTKEDPALKYGMSLNPFPLLNIQFKEQNN